MLGQIYQYFLEKFALAEGQGGGEFFTPTSVVKLMVEIIEPHRGTVFDPACGSGGMFVQSASFIEQRLASLNEDDKSGDLFVYGQEKTLDTVKLAKMNIAVNGLRGDVRHSEAEIRKTLIENNLIYGMLTLPSNMFYTVTLPATLWFFDKGKQDDRILFIDARNIFTQITRKLREFTEEQIQNIAIISKLHKGNRQAFIDLIDCYLDRGMELLLENQTQIEPISEQILEVLADEAGKKAVKDLVGQWQMLTKLESRYQKYLKHSKNLSDIAGKNSSEEKITDRGLENSSAKLYPKDTVVIAMYCAMAYISILAEPSSTNQACCAFLPKNDYLKYTYTYYLIKFAQNHLIQFAHGAAQQNLSQILIKKFSLLVADKNSILLFHEKVEPVFRQIKILCQQNNQLSNIRDSLLPRLISGKLSVEDLDIQFPPSML